MKIDEYIVDETLIKVGIEYIWLWVTIYRARKQANSRTLLAKSIQREKYVDSRKVSLKWYKTPWKASSFYGWRYMVPNGLSIP